MKRILLLLFLSLCAACMPHNKPIANIQFSGVTSKERIFPSLQEEGRTIRVRDYTMFFTSNIEILGLFKKEDGDDPLVSTRLVCALEDDINFSVKHVMQRYMRGNISHADLGESSRADIFSYRSKFNFFETKDNGGSESRLEKEELNSMLSQKKEIPCKVVMTVYLSTPYYSNTMYIPVKDILREVNK